MNTLPAAPSIPETPLGRLQLIADTLRVPVPEGLQPDLVDEDGAPAHALLVFCVTHGASLDFIYLGDLGGLIHHTSHSMLSERARR